MKPLLKQRGMALIMLVFIIALAAAAYLLHISNPVILKTERDKKTVAALSEAKAALIGWSVQNGTPGKLPCPEDVSLVGTPNEGSSFASCNIDSRRIGRLPWKTLGLGDIRDGNGDKLWYAISNGFRNSPINYNTVAGLTIDGVASKAVAIIFSAGPPLGKQSRTSNTDVQQYLDLTNNNLDETFQSHGDSSAFNDNLLAVSHAELFSLVANRILGEVRGDSAQGLMSYYSDPDNSEVFPYADANGDGEEDDVFSGHPSYQGDSENLFFNSDTKKMLKDNAWFSLVTYDLSENRKSVILSLYGKTKVVVP